MRVRKGICGRATARRPFLAKMSLPRYDLTLVANVARATSAARSVVSGFLGLPAFSQRL